MIYTLDGEVSKILLTTFSLEKIIHAKRKNVFEIFSNYEQYEKLIPTYFPSIFDRSNAALIAIEPNVVVGTSLRAP